MCYGQIISRIVALPLRWLCNGIEGNKQLGSFKPLWDKDEKLKNIVTSLFNQIQQSESAVPNSELLQFVHQFLVLQFTQENIPVDMVVGSIIEQMVLLFMIHPLHGWRSASFLIAQILCPLKNIARAVLLHSAFLNSFEKVYTPSSPVELPLAWEVNETCDNHNNEGDNDDIDESDEDSDEDSDGDNMDLDEDSDGTEGLISEDEDSDGDNMDLDEDNDLDKNEGLISEDDREDRIPTDGINESDEDGDKDGDGDNMDLDEHNDGTESSISEDGRGDMIPTDLDIDGEGQDQNPLPHAHNFAEDLCLDFLSPIGDTSREEAQDIQVVQ